MNRRHILAWAGAGLVAATLSGCTSFTPVYGDMAGTSLADVRFNFAPPNNRLEQIILNRLAVIFPEPASPSDPVLSVSARSSSPGRPLSDAFDVSTPVNVRVEASVTVTQADQTLFSATRFTDSAYQGGKLTPTNRFSAEGAREAAAESTAESLRAAIMAGYRPVSMQPR